MAVLSGQWSTGCPQVRVQSNTPLNSGSGWQILISFDVVIAECLRFFLMYNTWWFMNLAPPKILTENEVNISGASEQTVETRATRFFDCLLARSDFIFSQNFWGCQVHEPSSIIHQKKPKTLGYHHVEGYQDRSTWARVKGGVKNHTNFWTPSSTSPGRAK